MDTSSLEQIVQLFEDSKSATICLTNCRSGVRHTLRRFGEYNRAKQKQAQAKKLKEKQLEKEQKQQQKEQKKQQNANQNGISKNKDELEPHKEGNENIPNDNSTESLTHSAPMSRMQVANNVRIFVSTHDAVLYCKHLERINKFSQNMGVIVSNGSFPQKQKSDSVVNNAIDNLKIVMDVSPCDLVNNSKQKQHQSNDDRDKFTVVGVEHVNTMGNGIDTNVDADDSANDDTNMTRNTTNTNGHTNTNGNTNTSTDSSSVNATAIDIDVDPRIESD